MTKLKLKSPLNPIINALSELKEDITVPKNLRNKLQGIFNGLNEKIEISIKINKALDELEVIAEDVSLQPYTRTQIWNIISLLEMSET